PSHPGPADGCDGALSYDGKRVLFRKVALAAAGGRDAQRDDRLVPRPGGVAAPETYSQAAVAWLLVYLGRSSFDDATLRAQAHAPLTNAKTTATSPTITNALLDPPIGLLPVPAWGGAGADGA